MLTGLRSRRQIAPFALHRPATVAEAVALHQAPGTNAFLAGGIDLIDWLKYGNTLDRLIRLDGIAGLADITGDSRQLQIGALATHASIIDNPLIQDVLPDLARLWHQVANPRIRFVGTIGGNVMAGRADYDGPPALLALGAQTGSVEALVTGFSIPQPTGLRLFTDRSLRPAVSVWLGLQQVAGRVVTLRVAVGLAHPAAVCVTLHPHVPTAELGGLAADLAAQIVSQMQEPVTDGKATAPYRRRMVGVLTRRLLIQAGGAA